MVEKDACITLVKIGKNIHNEHGVQLSRTTINQVLSNELHVFSMKKIETVPDARNSLANKLKRKDYATWFQSLSDSDFTFFDESGFDLWQGRTRGRAKICEPAGPTLP